MVYIWQKLEHAIICQCYKSVCEHLFTFVWKSKPAIMFDIFNQYNEECICQRNYVYNKTREIML